MTPERNKAAAREEFAVWSSGKVERLDELVAPDVVHHDPHDPHAAEGLDGLKKSIQATHSRFPDFEITVDDQVAEGDRVATRWRARMTYEGTPRTMTGITIERVADGKVVAGDNQKTADAVASDDQIAGVVAVADKLRETAIDAIATCASSESTR